LFTGFHRKPQISYKIDLVGCIHALISLIGVWLGCQAGVSWVQVLAKEDFLGFFSELPTAFS